MHKGVTPETNCIMSQVFKEVKTWESFSYERGVCNAGSKSNIVKRLNICCSENG